jgi:hypothetical protein
MVGTCANYYLCRHKQRPIFLLSCFVSGQNERTLLMKNNDEFAS